MSFFLDASKPQELEAHLRQLAFLNPGEIIEGLEVPGAGNMNYTLRVKCPGRSFILKQARPYVEKYPQVAAPVERTEMEARFYTFISPNDRLAALSPELLHHDPENHLLILSDLGTGSDLSSLYQKDQQLDESEAIELIGYLSTLHRNFRIEQGKSLLPNRKMRSLNAEHIFPLSPYE